MNECISLCMKAILLSLLRVCMYCTSCCCNSTLYYIVTEEGPVSLSKKVQPFILSVPGHRIDICISLDPYVGLRRELQLLTREAPMILVCKVLLYKLSTSNNKRQRPPWLPNFSGQGQSIPFYNIYAAQFHAKLL